MTPPVGNQEIVLDEYDILTQELDVASPAISDLDEYESFIA